MPRFYFHTHDGVSIRDREGTVLASWHEAQLEAVRLAGNIIADNPLLLKLGEHWSMEVTDGVGLVLFRLDFHISAAPVITGSQ